MPFDGNGVFLRVMNWTNDKLSNIKIRADRHDDEDNNLASGLTNCITRDGQSAIMANLTMSGYRHTNVANALNRNEYASFGQIQDGSVSSGTIGGTSTSYTMTLAVNPSSYVLGQVFWGKINVTNTGAATLSIASLGAKGIKSFGTTDVVAGELVSGKLYAFQYDGTNFVILSGSQFIDGGLQILGSSDATKKATFEVDGLTTATTRTLTVQDVSGTIYVTGGTDVAVADGGTGASDAATARTNLGVAYATQAEAEAGTSNTVVSTPLRVFQAITKLTGFTKPLFTGEITTINFNQSVVYSLPHGLGVVPKDIDIEIVCVTANNGYAVGDVVKLSSFQWFSTFDRGCTLWCDATNAGLTLSTCFIFPKISGSSAFTPSSPNWKLRITARA